MKKFWSLLLCLLLALSLTLCLCACENDSTPDRGDSQPSIPSEPSEPENLLAGLWLGNLDLSKKLNAALSGKDLEILAVNRFHYRIFLELNRDGTAKWIIDQTSALNEYHWIASMLEQGLADVVPDAFDMSLEEFLESKDTTLDALINSIMGPFHPHAMNLDLTGYYRVTDGKLYLSEDTEFTEDEANAFTLSDDQLVIENESSAPFAPMYLERLPDPPK